MSMSYVYYDAEGHAFQVSPDCVSLHSDGCYYDDHGHTCTPQLDGYVNGAAGNDLIDINYTGDPQGDRIDHNDAVFGNVRSNDDIVYAYDGNDTVKAGDANDTVYGGDGRDSVFGGDGNDYIDTSSGDTNQKPDIGYPGLYTADTDVNNDKDTVDGGTGNDTIKTGDDADSIHGGDGNDSIDAGVDSDTVYGDAGNDTIIGAEGADYIDAGSGNDLVYGGYDPSVPDAVNIPDATDLAPTNGTDLIYGGDGNDTVFGMDDRDTIYGGAGNDSLDGGIDNDSISGGAGDDTQLGADGNDTLDGGDGNDSLSGGTGQDLLFGGSGNDKLDGGDGNDTVFGGDGNDQITGDAGDDLLVGDGGNDKIEGGDGNDTLEGSDGNDDLRGGAGNDQLIGDGGQDQLRGDEGNDVLSGGADHDEMFGGDDRDLFINVGDKDVIDGNEGGDDFDTLDLTGAGPLHVTYNPGDPESGKVTFYDDQHNVTGTLIFKNIENVIPCFTPGTLIATPRGEVPVEDLRAGDKVITRDNGLQEIRWTGRKDMEWANLLANPHLKPVLIRAGALGNGLPERDMMVSPNHRVLVANDRTQLYFDEHEVLVSAKHLITAQGVQVVNVARTAYIHFLCDRHEVVLSNGAWTETFQPGDYTLKGMGNAQRSEIFELFPDLKTHAGVEAYTAARRTLKRHEALLALR